MSYQQLSSAFCDAKNENMERERMITQYDYDNLKTRSESSSYKFFQKYEGNFTTFENCNYESVLVRNTFKACTLTLTNLGGTSLPSETLVRTPRYNTDFLQNERKTSIMVTSMNVLQGAQRVSKLLESTGEYSGVVGSAAGNSISKFHIL